MLGMITVQYVNRIYILVLIRNMSLLIVGNIIAMQKLNFIVSYSIHFLAYKTVPCCLKLVNLKEHRYSYDDSNTSINYEC